MLQAKPDGRNHPGVRRAGCPHPAAPCGGANTRGRDKSRPYDQRKARTQPGNRAFCGIANLCRGRFHIGPGTPRRRKHPGRIWNPPLRINFMLQTKPDGRNHPGVRRAGCPHPPHPRRRKHPGRIGIRPYATANARPTGTASPPRQTSVGDDACTAPAGAFRRPTGPQARLLGRRSSREPRGGVRFPGRAMALPYKPRNSEIARSDQTGTAVTTRAFVGRDALIPPHPRGGANARGRDKSRPYDRRKARTQPGNGNLAVPQAPVGDDACIVPGTLRRRKVPRAG